MTKTNAARILDKLHINYSLVAYEVNEDDLSATTVALKVGQDPNQVFKTLVAKGDKTGILVAVIPGNEELDLKKTAKTTGNKNIEMVPVKELLNLTGYIRGGCSPLGMKKNYPVFVHETCYLFDEIFISAGVRGLQIKLKPEHLILATSASVSDLT